MNVDGTLNLLEFAQREGESHGRPVVFVYPIVDCGLRAARPGDASVRAGRVREDEWNAPQTMYGCNKLYCEHLGRYYSRHYKQLAAESTPRVDFRCLRFPGPDLGRDDAGRRHVRLRAGDAACRRAR